MDVSGPELFHPGAHAAPAAEEPAHAGRVGETTAHFGPPLARYTLQDSHSKQLQQHGGFWTFINTRPSMQVRGSHVRCAGTHWAPRTSGVAAGIESAGL